MWETWVGKSPLRSEGLPTPVFWPGEFRGLSSPWGRKESDTTERISLSLSFSIMLGRYHLFAAAVLGCVPTFQPTSVKITRRNTNSPRTERRRPPCSSIRVWRMGGIIMFCPTNNHSAPQQQGGEQNAYPLQKVVGRVWATVMHQLLKCLSMTRIFHFPYTFIFQVAFYMCDFL